LGKKYLLGETVENTIAKKKKHKKKESKELYENVKLQENSTTPRHC